ncbi:MAG: VOC family protein [Anaerolineae bacterium]|nr:VOC family protein [Anaerolineae bacterium]
MNFSFGEINIICTNLDRTLHFYRDVLGFTPTTDEEGFYHMKFGGNQFLLLPIASQPLPESPYGSMAGCSLDLQVGDLKAAYDYFVEQGVTIDTPWQPGKSMFVIRDPDGLPWEIVGAMS